MTGPALHGRDGGPLRLAYLVTHPIQYQAPLLARIAAEPDIALTVFFQSDLTLGTFRDPGFGRAIAWDVDLTAGYAHHVLPALAGRRTVSTWLPVNRGLARRLREGRFDALWVHGFARPAHLLAIARARRLGLRVLLRDEANDLGPPRTGLRAALRARLLGWLVGRVDAWLAIGTANARHLARVGVAPERIHPMPYAVDNRRFAAGAEAARPGRARLRAALELAPDRPVVLFAAKLAAHKRPADLIAAMHRLPPPVAARRPYLLLAGDGPERARLERAAGGEAVRFLGFVTQGELPALYDLADVLVLPSAVEPWGLVVNEAMCASTAIVASDRVGAAADLVVEGETGAVFPAGDVAALAAALARVLADPATARHLGTAGRERIRSWDFEADVAGLRAALAAVAAGPDQASSKRRSTPEKVRMASEVNTQPRSA